MILITNPTGRIGSNVAQALLASGQPMRLLTRDASKLPQNLQKNDIVIGSHSDQAAVTKAMEGVNRVFWCVPQNHQLDNFLDYYLNFSRAFADALKTSSVTQVVGISSGGKGRVKAEGPISSLHAMEDMVNASGVATRFLRSGNFIENLLWQVVPIKQRGVIGYPIDGDSTMPNVAIKDIAAVATSWLLSENWNGQQGVAVHGPADLSFNQVAAILSQALNKPITFHRTPDTVYLEILRKSGCSNTFAQGLLNMFQEIERHIYEAEPRTPQSTTPTTLLEWAKEVLAPIVDA